MRQKLEEKKKKRDHDSDKPGRGGERGGVEGGRGEREFRGREDRGGEGEQSGKSIGREV